MTPLIEEHPELERYVPLAREAARAADRGDPQPARRLALVLALEIDEVRRRMAEAYHPPTTRAMARGR